LIHQTNEKQTVFKITLKNKLFMNSLQLARRYRQPKTLTSGQRAAVEAGKVWKQSYSQHQIVVTESLANQYFSLLESLPNSEGWKVMSIVNPL